MEKFKSYNSTTLYSLIHIINMSNKIKDDIDTNIKNVKQLNPLINRSLYDFIELYLNQGVKGKTIYENLQKLKKQNRIVNNPQIAIFLAQIEESMNKIIHAGSIKSKAIAIPIDAEISALNSAFNTKHRELMSYNERVLYIILFISILLIFILFYTYMKSLKIKQELLSFRHTVENSDNSIVITDKDRRITYVNDTFVKMPGFTKKEVLGQNPRIFKSGKLPKEFYDNMNAVLNKRQKWFGEFINKKKNGEIYYEKSSITPIINNDKLIGYLAIKLDVTDYINQQQKLEFLVYHDSLTSLLNRLSLNMMLIEEKQKIRQDHHSLSLLFIDLDDFKSINDTLGYEIGDEVLKKIATMLKIYIKEYGIVFRTGGDEFAILLSYKIDNSIKTASDILQMLNEPIFIDGISLKIGVSIGIARYTKEKDISVLIKNADMALHRAKRNGKNQYFIFNKQLSDEVHKKWEIEQALSNALKNHEFYVVYQPKYDLLTKKFSSLEALIRWENDKLGMIPPDYFIPIAEDLSLIHEIGKFVFMKSCEDFVEFKKYYPKLQSVSINVSASQLINKNLAKDFQNIMKNYDIAPSNIGIEVTETHIMHDVDENIISLQEMKNLGFQILLDDFGTGYSSMSYLKKLPIEVLKIDKSFVDNICTDINDVNIIKATVAISKSLGYKTIAEGVETKEQEDILLDLGVDYAQGYLFSKPKTKKELIDFMKNLS